MNKLEKEQKIIDYVKETTKKRDFYYFDCDFTKTSNDKKTAMEKEYEAFKTMHTVDDIAHKSICSSRL